MLGHEIGTLAVRYIGFTGATLLLLALLAVGWSLFSGMSWLNAAERVGAMLEGSYLGIRDLYERWQDRRIGREVAQQREVEVEVERERVEQHEPIFIEMPAPVVEVSKKVEKRIERERQTPLFPEVVEGGMLPPLHLLAPGSPTDRSAQCRNAGIHLAPDRTQARRIRCAGACARGLSRPGGDTL